MGLDNFRGTVPGLQKILSTWWLLLFLIVFPALSESVLMLLQGFENVFICGEARGAELVT